jgi:hypothetical protein
VATCLPAATASRCGAQYSRHREPAEFLESLRAATDGTAALLCYKPDTVDKDLGAARDRLTGEFKDSYT